VAVELIGINVRELIPGQGEFFYAYGGVFGFNVGNRNFRESFLSHPAG